MDDMYMGITRIKELTDTTKKEKRVEKMPSQKRQKISYDSTVYTSRTAKNTKEYDIDIEDHII